MSKITFDMKFDLGAIDKWEADLIEEAEMEMEAFGMDVVREAKQNAPVDNGPHRNLISSKPIPGRIGVEITSGANYAAFVEFGTGQFAASYVSTLPVDIQAYALQFFVSGKGRLPARPHLIPAILRNLPKLEARLKAIKP